MKKINGYRQYTDSTLMSLPKRKIIELLRVAEHNYFVTVESLKNSAKAGRELAKKHDKHGVWVKTGRTNGYGETEYKCSNCQATIYVPGDSFIEREKYCYKCGFKMDLKDGECNV